MIWHGTRHEVPTPRPARRKVGTTAFLLNRINGEPHDMPLLGAELDLVVYYIEALESAGAEMAAAIEEAHQGVSVKTNRALAAAERFRGRFG